MSIKALGLAALMVTGPAFAQQSAQLHLVAYTPVECEVRLLSVAATPRSSRVRVQTRCNVPHHLELYTSTAGAGAVAATDSQGHRAMLQPGKIVLPGIISNGTTRTIEITHLPGRELALESVVVSQSA